MKIGELAKLSGIAASRIRFYEAHGLLQPAQRQANGYREYGPETVTRLEIIHRAQGAGFSLEEIRAILPPDLNTWPHEALLQAFRHKIDEIELLEQHLAQTKRHLLALIDEIANKTAGEDCKDAAKRVLDKLRRDGVGQSPTNGRSRPARMRTRA
ncbi:MerR family transcriptional regulator [Burkholderia mayonis]|uniref:MerR family transcriptional regulator n=1 Tax=Burkholderia mayonis TaxID=1385591 RepID=A0A1B4G2X5_9BURK|nr:MerR family transcriptional regulator [Burkholderia mayonis]AOJ10274.1 MerR family transcriptional regulator [Burkholderia mayonis]KVE53744.1 MerR family transcriptional regulator [Burkholderia mayonis]